VKTRERFVRYKASDCKGETGDLLLSVKQSFFGDNFARTLQGQLSPLMNDCTHTVISPLRNQKILYNWPQFTRAQREKAEAVF
jgi:hypothetical protein